MRKPWKINNQGRETVVQTDSGEPCSLNDATSLYEDAFSLKTLGETLHPGGLALTKRALEMSSLPAAARILDAGCGAGLTVQYLGELGYTAYGVDLSALLVKSGLQRGEKLGLLQADAVHLPLPAESLEAVLSECSLSVFKQPDQVLNEFHRVLSQGGTLILTDLYARNPSGLADFQKLIPSSCLAKSFVAEKLLSCLDSSGFEVATWEDHSEVIKSLSGQPTLKSLGCTPDCAIDPVDLFLSIIHARLGYFICLARKR